MFSRTRRNEALQVCLMLRLSDNVDAVVKLAHANSVSGLPESLNGH